MQNLLIIIISDERTFDATETLYQLCKFFLHRCNTISKFGRYSKIDKKGAIKNKKMA